MHMLKRTLLVAASATLVATGFAVSASAAGDAPPPSGLPCRVAMGAMTCFQASGDHMWVKDLLADGHHARGFINSSYSTYWQSPWCKNYAGYGTWKHCDFDVPDGQPAYIHAQAHEGEIAVSHAYRKVTS